MLSSRTEQIVSRYRNDSVCLWENRVAKGMLCGQRDAAKICAAVDAVVSSVPAIELASEYFSWEFKRAGLNSRNWLSPDSIDISAKSGFYDAEIKSFSRASIYTAVLTGLLLDATVSHQELLYRQFDLDEPYLRGDRIGKVFANDLRRKFREKAKKDIGACLTGEPSLEKAAISSASELGPALNIDWDDLPSKIVDLRYCQDTIGVDASIAGLSVFGYYGVTSAVYQGAYIGLCPKAEAPNLAEGTQVVKNGHAFKRLIFRPHAQTLIKQVDPIDGPKAKLLRYAAIRRLRAGKYAPPLQSEAEALDNTSLS